RTAPTSRPAGGASATARSPRASLASRTRSTAAAWPWGAPWWPSWRTTSRPMDRWWCRRPCARTWTGGSGSRGPLPPQRDRRRFSPDAEGPLPSIRAGVGEGLGDEHARPDPLVREPWTVTAEGEHVLRRVRGCGREARLRQPPAQPEIVEDGTV